VALLSFTFDPEPTEAFLRLGYDAYAGDPGFVPPLRAEVRAQLEPGFPFYRRPGNDHRRFLVLANGRPVARALASVNRDLRDRDGSRVGAVGFFEALDHDAGADVLEASCTWLREEHGLGRVLGPLNFDVWHGYRLMTSGFGRSRFFGEPYNRAGYPELFEDAGFTPRRRWRTYRLEPEAVAALAEGDRSAFTAFTERGYRLVPFGALPYDEAVGRLHDVLVRSFAGFLAFTGISLPEFRALTRWGRHAFHPSCSFFILDEKGASALFTGVLFDLAEPVRAMGGESGLLSRWRFFAARAGVGRLLVHLGGLSPEEAAKHNGLARAAFALLMGRLRALGVPALATLIAAGNPVRRLLGEAAERADREYVLYERAT